MKNTPSLLEPLETRYAPATLFAVSDMQFLITVDSAHPDQILDNRPITGLNAGEEVVSLDLRPDSGELYAFTNQDRLGIIDPETGALAVILADVSPSGAAIGFDFNPVTDRLHLVTSLDEHFEIAVDGSAPGSGLPTLAYAAGDTNFGENPAIAAIAFSNNVSLSHSTVFYGIDHGLDVLVSINSATGAVHTIGTLGIDVSSVSFDIVSEQNAIAVATQGGVTKTFQINLQSGTASSLGNFTTGIRAMTAALPSKVVTINGNTATFTESDGDKVTIKISKGTFTQDNFILSGYQDGVGKLLRLDLHGDAQYAGANITLTAVRGTSGGGDGFASLGYLDATGIDLGKVLIDGDLGRIDAGNAGAKALGLQSLTVQSLGFLGGAAGGGNQASHIEGSVGTLTIKGNIDRASFHVEDTSTASALGKIGTTVIGGSIVGGTEEYQGSLFAETLGAVKVGGSLQGSHGLYSGSITTTGHMGAVQIGGSVIGAEGTLSGAIYSTVGAIASVKLGGDLRGGEGNSSAVIGAQLSIGQVRIGGDVQGDGEFSGVIASQGSVAGVTIGGSFLAGEGEYSGSIVSGAKLGAVKIGGDVRGSATQLANIVARGTPNAAGTTDLAIHSITVKGSVDRAQILAGADLTTVEIVNADAQIGAVSVGGNWSCSSITAGVGAGMDEIYGSADDEAPADAQDSAKIVSRIASITIRGQVVGSPGADSDTDGYGFVAQEIGSFSLGGMKLSLNKGAGNDNVTATVPRYDLGATHDVRLHEVSV